MNHPTNINNNGPVVKYTDMKEEMKNEVLETARLGITIFYVSILYSIVASLVVIVSSH